MLYEVKLYKVQRQFEQFYSTLRFGNKFRKAISGNWKQLHKALSVGPSDLGR